MAPCSGPWRRTSSSRSQLQEGDPRSSSPFLQGAWPGACPPQLSCGSRAGRPPKGGPNLLADEVLCQLGGIYIHIGGMYIHIPLKSPGRAKGGTTVRHSTSMFGALAQGSQPPGPGRRGPHTLSEAAGARLLTPVLFHASPFSLSGSILSVAGAGLSCAQDTSEAL